jgi:integron integrase
MNHKDKKLLDRVHDFMRSRHYSIRTEKTYCEWIKKFALHYDMKSMDDFKDGAKKVETYLTYLAVEKNVAPATQNQAMNALVFLYKNILDQPFDQPINAVRSSRRTRLPEVLTEEEVLRLFDLMSKTSRLMAELMYGAGLRVMECVRLRVQDLDFATNRLTVRAGKGNKDRWTLLPESLHPVLKRHLERVKQRHDEDIAEGFGEVYMPHLLAKKYPNQAKAWPWQYVFPAAKRSVDPLSGQTRRHHVMPEALQNAVRNAARAAGFIKRVTCHTLRHSFATHLLLHGTDIRSIQELMGHDDLNTTMIYTHVLRQWQGDVESGLLEPQRHTSGTGKQVNSYGSPIHLQNPRSAPQARPSSSVGIARRS